MNKVVYHGGNGAQGGKYSSRGAVTVTDEIDTLIYAEPGFLTTGSFVNPTTEGTAWFENGVGHHVGQASHIVGWSGLIIDYVTFNATSICTIRFCYIVASGVRTSPIIITSGVTLGDVSFPSFPDTGGFSQYYRGGSDFTINWSVPANSMVYAYVLSETLNTIHGLTMWIRLKKG